MIRLKDWKISLFFYHFENKEIKNYDSKCLKFNKSEENQLQDIKEKLRSEKKLTSSLRVKVTDTIIKRFSKLGYEVQIKVLIAADFFFQIKTKGDQIGGLEKYPVKFPEPSYKEKFWFFLFRTIQIQSSRLGDC